MFIRRFFGLLVLISLAPLTSMAPGQIDQKRGPGKRYALIIGVNEYDHDKLSSLKYAENDAEGLARVLDGYEVTVMTKARGKSKNELVPTAKNIRVQLARLFAKKTRHDTILIGLGGHGLQLDLHDPEDKGPSKTLPMFCPSDAQLNDTDYKTGKSPTLLNLDHLLEDIGECGAGTKMLLIDACRNEVKGQSKNVSASAVRIPKGVAVLFSCSEGQRSWETAKLGKGNGVFFHHVIEALKDGDAVAWTDLVKRVIDKVEDDVDKLIGEGAKQEPHEVRSGGRAPLVVARGDVNQWFEKAVALHFGQGVKQDHTEAVRLYRKAADKGHAAAMFNLGFCFARGEGVPQDNKEAVKWFLQAAGKGDTDAMFSLAWRYEEGLGVAKDSTQAVVWYQKAAEKGHASATSSLARMYKKGLGVQKDEKVAAKWYKQAADLGDEYAMDHLGDMYADGLGVVKDDKEAFKWYKMASAKNHTFAMNSLARMYANGRGVDKDEKEAFKWFHKSADLGNEFAMDSLGDRFAEGRGVVKNEKEAIKWYKKAAEKGRTSAMNSLARIYANGRGVDKDEKEALKWFTQSAALNNEFAMDALGDMYAEGRGVAKDEKEAFKWYKKAAELGNPFSMNSLARMYELGLGVDKNLAEALRWYKNAAALGRDSAKRAVERLEGKK